MVRPLFRLATIIAFIISFLNDPNNETAAKFRNNRAKVEALEKLERIGEGALATVGSPVRDAHEDHRLAIFEPTARPAMRLN